MLSWIDSIGLLLILAAILKVIVVVVSAAERLDATLSEMSKDLAGGIESIVERLDWLRQEIEATEPSRRALNDGMTRLEYELAACHTALQDIERNVEQLALDRPSAVDDDEPFGPGN